MTSSTDEVTLAEPTVPHKEEKKPVVAPPHTQLETAVEPIRSRDYGFLPIPKSSRFDPQSPPKFTLALNVFFGLGATIAVANLYYNQTLLVHMADTFNVDYNEISQVAVLTQVGYAIGIVFIAPLGDLIRRRSLVVLLFVLSGSLSIGLPLVKTVSGFKALSLLIGMVSIPGQILIPLTADLAPAHRRSAAISITWSGLLLGQLIGRVIAGTMANFVHWTNVYWLAVGMQFCVLFGMWVWLPDYPRKNTEMSYFGVLWSMVKFVYQYPTLVQTCLIAMMTASVFSGWWTTLTYLLTDTYNYNSLYVGLFGLAGMAGIMTAPLIGRLVDKLVPWVGQFLALSIQMCSMAIAVGAAEVNISAVIIVCFTLDVGLQLGNVSNSTRIYALNPAARARMNSLLVLCLFIGQIMGTAIQTKLYTAHGYRANAGYGLACLGFAMFVLVSRGPFSERWIGWDGEVRFKKELNGEEKESKATEKARRQGQTKEVEKTQATTGTQADHDIDIEAQEGV